MQKQDVYKVKWAGHVDGLDMVVRKSEGSRFWPDILNNTMYCDEEQSTRRSPNGGKSGVCSRQLGPEMSKRRRREKHGLYVT